MDTPSAVAPSMPRRAWRWLVALIACYVAFFGILSIEHAFALAAGRPDWASRLLAFLTSESFVYGPGSALAGFELPYRSAVSRIDSHMALGGLALGLGALQFVHALRRRYPIAHRAMGLVVWLAMAASLASAMAFLLTVPLHTGKAGAAFQVGLWALDLLTAFLLAQAILAALSRDHRSHMVWMALTYAALLTAPVLRFDWWVMGRFTSFEGAPANLVTGVVVLMQTMLLMGLWLTFSGDAALPERRAPGLVWPRWLVDALCVLTALAAVQEGVLSPQRWFDVYGSARGSLDRMPPVAGLAWAGATIAAMIVLPAAWRRAMAGERPGKAMTLAVAACAAASLAVAITSDHGTTSRLGVASFWIGYAVFLAASIALAWAVKANSAGRNAWSLVTLAALWLPSQLPAMIALGRVLGLDFDEANAHSLVDGSGGLLVAGFVTGFGARLRLWAALRRAPSPRPATATEQRA